MMNITEITEKAYAKLNLWLEVTGKRDDGYHDLVSVMQSISLYDTVKLSINKKKTVEITCTDTAVPSDERNIAYKAARLFFEELGEPDVGVNIDIVKQIPSEAGLGGGSSDAAAVLRGLNRIYGSPFDVNALRITAKKLGADVPFCISGGTMLAEGIGELLTPIAQITKEDGVYFTVCRGADRMSTPKAFSELDKTSYVPKNPSGILKAIEEKSLKSLSAELFNRFETVVPPSSDISKVLLENGASGILLSGSGTALFGVFDSFLKAEEAADAVKKDGGFACTAYAEKPLF